MATLQADFSQPDLSQQNFKACDPVSWSFGNSPNLTEIYGAQDDAGKLVFVNSPNSVGNNIYFSEGIILEASRTVSPRNGEVFGFVFDLRNMSHAQEIRIEIDFDYIEAKRSVTVYRAPFWALVRLYDVIRIPFFRPGLGLGHREFKLLGGSAATHPFLGALSGFTTNGDMTLGTVMEGSDKMDVVTLQVKYDPDSAQKSESMRINTPFAQGTRFAWLGFSFLRDAFYCPIQKMLGAIYAIFGEPWHNNPRYPYKLEIQIKVSDRNRDAAGVGIRLRRTTNGTTYEAFGAADELDTTRFQSNNWTDDLSGIKFAGANVVIGSPVTKEPPTNFGPLRVRIKKLLVECI